MSRKKATGAMSHRVIKTKFGPPRVSRKILRRERALSLLNLGADRVLTLLCAPAGFGKTMVLADWRAQLVAANRPVAWVTLDEDDNDANSFVTYVVRALGEALGSLADHVPELGADAAGAAPKLVLTSVINALDSIDTAVTLVLDDYDRIHAGGIHNLVSFLLLHAPQTLHVVIAARAEPPLPLTYLRAHDELVEIDAAQLRFSFDDARRFFREVAALQLDAGALRSVHDATEGWVAGMQMAAISLRDRTDASPLIEGLAGRSRAIHEYLADAVLSRLDGDSVDVLLRSSIVERFDGRLCEALTEVADGTAWLARMHQQNAFLQALDDERSWFRYHALFRDFLRGELARRWPGEVAALHERAARWFAGQQLWAEAVRHALAADRVDLATQWVEHCAMREVEDSRVHGLLAWVRKLPDSALRTRHRLRLAVAWALLLTIQLAEAMAIVDDLSAQMQGDPVADPSIESELLALRFCITALQDDTAAALPIGEHFLARYRQQKRHEEQVIWSVQATLNGLTHCYQKAGRLDEARAMQGPELYPRSREPSRNLFTQCYRATTLGACDVREGRLFDGARQMREAMTLAERYAGRRSAAATLVACSLAALHYEWNELDEVDQLLADRLDIVDEACYLDSVRSAYLTLARLSIVRGQYESAHALLDRGELVASRRGWDRLTAVCLAERVRLCLLERHPLEARAACERLERLTSAEPPARASARSETWRVRGMARARWLLHDGQAGAALALLQTVLDDENPQRSLYPCVRTRALLATALQADGQPAAAQIQLAQLVAVGTASGLIRSIADEGEAIRRLFETAPATSAVRSPASSAWYRAVMDALPAKHSADELDADAPAAPRPDRLLIEPLSKRERDVLTLVARGLSNDQTARALRLGSETVKWHLKNVFSKLGVSRRTLAIHRARQLDLIPDDPADS